MTAAWKQKKFERLAQKDVVEELKAKVAQLKELVDQHKAVNKMVERDREATARQRDEYSVYARRYLKLRSEEIMLATPDGFKLMTGEELDIHCGQIEDRTTWWGHSVDSQIYSQQMRRAMVYGSSIVKMGIENGFNPDDTTPEP